MIKYGNKWTIIFLVIVTIMISKSCAESQDTSDRSWKAIASLETAGELHRHYEFCSSTDHSSKSYESKISSLFISYLFLLREISLNFFYILFFSTSSIWSTKADSISPDTISF